MAADRFDKTDSQSQRLRDGKAGPFHFSFQNRITSVKDKKDQIDKR